MIIGVTDEKVSLVDKWVAENKPDYPIVILEDGTLEDALGVAFFPTAAVVDPDGIIIFSGSAGAYSSPLEKALKSATKGSVIPMVFAKFTKELKAGETGKAYDIVVGMVESGKLDGAELGWGRKLQTWLESEAESALVRKRKPSSKRVGPSRPSTWSRGSMAPRWAIPTRPRCRASSPK